MAYEYFYPGTPYSLDPKYGNLFTGYRMSAGRIGSPTSIQTANQIQEVSNLLNQGINTIELQPISPEVFDQIPKQHFKEINRLTKLTGANTTVHAPMIDPSGFTKEGWSEFDRETAERQLKSVIDRSHDLSPKGNMPITIHASGIPGSEWMPTPEGVKVKRMIAMNQETKQLVPIDRDVKFYPETGREVKEPKDEIKLHNNTEWINSITNLAFYKKEADEVMKRAHAVLAPIIALNESGEKIDLKQLTGQQKQAFGEMQRAELFLENVESSFRSLYNKAYKYSDPGVQKFLENEIAAPWKKEAQESRKKLSSGQANEIDVVDRIIKRSALVDDTLSRLKIIGEQLPTPQVYKPVEEFATDKAAQTLGNVAFHGYKEFGKNAPIVSIENLFPGMAFSRSEQLKKLVEEARNKFVENAQKQGYSKSDAQEASKKLIGVTWDVGHLNILRKEGFKKEDIINETKEIAKFVKHVHLTDNFGYSDSHLSPGMGNVPIKEILEELEKQGYTGKGIVEAGGFVQHFKTSPHPYVLEALGSPLYPMMQAPYWNQIQGTYGNYFALPAAYFPEQHFSLYGSGFSQLPAELGGQIPGKQSRMTGTPME